MARYDLSISINYTNSWTVVEAVREIFQNCIDEEAQHGNRLIFEYDKDSKELRIGNEGGGLEKRTLLLGISGKADDENTIGMHGEGYKIATAVLLRLGYSLNVYNGNKNETWEAKIIKSRRYGEDIVSFDISKSCANYIGSTVFVIGGISEEDFESIVVSNLHLIEKYKGSLLENSVIHTKTGDLLKDAFFKGKIFVGGLYVCTRENFAYGYNLVPKDVKLDRDRNSVDEVVLKTKTGFIVYGTKDLALITEMLQAPECAYARYDIASYKANYETREEEKTLAERVGDTLVAQYQETYGEDVVLSDDSAEVHRYSEAGMNAVYVSVEEKTYINESTLYEKMELPEEEKLSDVVDSLREFYSRLNSISDDEAEEFESIIERFEKFE